MRRILLIALAALAMAAEPFDEANFIKYRDQAATDTRDYGDATLTINGPQDTIIKTFHPVTRTRINASGQVILVAPKGRLLYISVLLPAKYGFAGVTNALVQHQIYAIYKMDSNTTTTISFVNTGLE